VVTVPETMPAGYPFSPRNITVAGQYRLSFLDEGRGRAVVFVHGNPSWSYLYRNMVADLRENFRCIAPDHIGCGFSDKPQEYSYRLADHIDNLETLLDALHVEKCVLVMHDWGGAIGMGWAVNHPERVEKLVVMNTAAFRSNRIPLRISVCRWPLAGPLLVRGLNVFAGAAVYMAVAGKMKREVAAGFLLPYDSWANRVAILRFVQDIPLDENHPSWKTLLNIENRLGSLRNTPMLVCWGGRDFCFTEHFYRQWQQRFPGAQGHYFAHAGHYLLEDAYGEIFPLVQKFISSGSRTP
jgi:haloalkane dehalogenase